MIRSIRLAAGAAAIAALAACGGPQQQADTFKPVPVSPVIGDVVMGSETAPVELVEYAALNCHVCRDFAKQHFPRIKAQYIDTGKVKYIYRDFPLEFDEKTGKAAAGFGVVLASVARCGGRDKFYEIVDAIFTAQLDLNDAARKAQALPVVLKVAGEHGLSEAEVRTCIDYQPELKASIMKSRDDNDSRVKGTPTIYVNNELAPHHIYDILAPFLDKKIAEATGQPVPATPAPGTPTAPASPASATPPAQ